MSEDVTTRFDPAHEKQELSCLHISSLLRYLDGRLGPERVAQAVEPLGLPLAYLRNTGNWVSFEFTNSLMAKLVEETEDEQAPYKAAFSVRPRELRDSMLFAAGAAILSGSPKAAYRISLGSDSYKRWMRIGEFSILESSPTSMRVSLTLKEGYRQTRAFCLAVQGMLASVPLAIGLPKASIQEIQCAAEGAAGCMYLVKWKNRSNRPLLYGLPLLAVLLAVEAVFTPSLFHVHDIAITFLSVSTLMLLARTFQFRKSLRQEESLSQERDELLVKALKKIEKDYRQLFETQSRLEERTQFLSIVNEVAASISREASLPSLVANVAALLRQRLGFFKGEFFQYDEPNRRYLSFIKKGAILPESEYLSLETRRFSVPASNVSAEAFPTIHAWRRTSSADLYIMPVFAPEAFSGFYCFLSESSRSSSLSLVEPLFESIASQLKVAFLKIASKNVIDTILASIPAYVLIFNRDTLIVRYVNKHFMQSFTKSEAAAVGSPLFSLFPFAPEALGNIESIARGIEMSGRSAVFEAAIGPSVYEYSVFAIPQASEGERLAGIIISDISEAKYFQKNLLINEKLLALGRVASGIAHEINNPLYAVLANAEEIVDDQTVSGDSRALAQEIIEHVMNVSNVIRDLSNYSKSLRKEERTDIDVNSVIEESLVLVRYGSNIMEIDVEKDLRPLPALRATKGEMQQVFINIFTNAIHAMEGKGTLSIRSRCEQDGIEVAISDTGTGIRESDLPYIFDLFFTTKKTGEGTGQGLYIVKKIMASYGGSIAVRSEEGRGTTFTLRFDSRRS